MTDVEEELVDVPEEEKAADPLRRATIKRMLDGVAYHGAVEDIEEGKESHDRLYLVTYTDGDLEHLTADQVKEMSCPVEDYEAHAPVEKPAELVGAEDTEGQTVAVKRDIDKKPAVKGGPKAAVKAKAKPAPKAVSKKPARA
mmetsp:Transcript_4400/g.12450  ORF Transcript_4400/g.12450 Transcript_4400/m.12450 type:complete len:142 (-) Transcript_4400:193-618(-)